MTDNVNIVWFVLNVQIGSCLDHFCPEFYGPYKTREEAKAERVIGDARYAKLIWMDLSDVEKSLADEIMMMLSIE